MDNILKIIGTAIEHIIRSGQPYNGLFPSLLDCRTGEMLQQMPKPIPGQRDSDRAHLGSNLMHDHTLLATMYALAETEGKREYADAADSYLQYFAVHCTHTATGLFPWGEHAFWHLTEDRVGSSIAHYDPERRSIHDHLRQAPLWLWEKLHSFNPACVQRFADGLEYHWKEGVPREYYRHAEITRQSYMSNSERSCDFPRHSGFYIFDLAYAYKHSKRPELLRQIEEMLDYWWDKQGDQGLLLIESRSPVDAVRFNGINSPSQTLSLAASLLDTAELLDSIAPDHAETMRVRAASYITGFLAAPHDLDRRIFVNLCTLDNRITEQMSVWGSVYGIAIVSSSALLCLCVWRYCREDRLLAWAKAAGECYLEQPFPVISEISIGAQGIRPHENINLIGHHYVPSGDAGLALELLADLYVITGEAKWLDGGLKLAEQFIPIYFDHIIPRGAAGGIDYYESQMNPGYLMHGMARLALLARDGRNCGIQAEYTAR